MVEHWRRWDDMPLDERIRRNYPVDEETAYLIAQRFLELALTGLDAGATVRKAYSGRQLQELLDKAAHAVLEGLSKQD
jgi:hypothetical protein